MVKNIVFDMGKVLIHWNPEYMLAQQNISDYERALIQKELFQNIEWIQLDRGVMTEDQVVKTVCSRLPENLHNCVDTLVHSWYQQYLLPVNGMADLVKELKQNHYHIYLLSNAGTALRNYFYRIPGSEYFDGLMVSAEEKLLKPQHEIYERLYERFSLIPEECWFIDDFAPNIEGALMTGMRGTIFRGDVSELRKALAAEGILCLS